MRRARQHERDAERLEVRPWARSSGNWVADGRLSGRDRRSRCFCCEMAEIGRAVTGGLAVQADAPGGALLTGAGPPAFPRGPR